LGSFSDGDPVWAIGQGMSSLPPDETSVSKKKGSPTLNSMTKNMKKKKTAISPERFLDGLGLGMNMMVRLSRK
jgi:hypothetical protein